MTADVVGELGGGAVAAAPVLLERLHHDPVEVAAERASEPVNVEAPMPRDRGVAGGADPEGRPRRLLLPDDALDLREPRLHERRRVERGRARKQLVEQHPQRVDVGAGVDVERRHLRLLGAHVRRRADELLVFREERLLGEAGVHRLGHAEIDDLRHRASVVRWITPFWCACCRAWQTGTKSSSRSRGVRSFLSAKSVIDTPRTSSITKYGRPDAVEPPSSTRAMLG